MNNKTIDITSWTGGTFVCSSCREIKTQGAFTWFESYRGLSVKLALCTACAKDYANKLIKESEKSRELARKTFYDEGNNERR